MKLATHEEEEIKQFYEEITTAAEDKNINSTISMVDFSANIGNKTKYSENKIGNNGLAMTIRHGKLVDWFRRTKPLCNKYVF